MITPQALQEFKIIYKQEIGKDINDEKLEELAQELLVLFDVIYKPLKVNDETVN